MPKWLKRTGYVVLALFLLFNAMMASQAYYFTHFFPLSEKPATHTELSGMAKWKVLLLGMPFYKSRVVDSLNIPHQNMTLATADMQELSTWFIPKDSAPGTIIVFHGHGSNKSALIPEERAFHTMGYQVLAVDFRAHGNSTGAACTVGYKEAADVKAAYDYVKAHTLQPIILYGISLGAATIVQAMQQYALSPDKVILEMPFGTLQKAAEGKLRTMHLPTEPLATALTFWGGIEQGFWAFNFKPQDAAAAIHCPVLLQWGLQDQRVTQTETNTIFKNLASHNKELVVYALSHHQSLLQNEPAKWEKTVSNFLYKQY
ncbi:alpha/beta fold hydrolase [Hydrotalea sp.]|uniref:alpha/beta hydrolase n=1 Tax=Hydrotalea sp. TaxID=2881279 RepID=UPI002622029F|nr:alpha/beta fold hydrolase [Hydrotalea sp.]